MKTLTVQKTALYGIFAAFSLILGYIEHLVPLPIGIYGIKLGLANIATVVTLYLLGGTAAITLNLIRIIVSAILFGNAVSLAYSLFGGMISCIIMIALKRCAKFSCVGISICGGVSHNAAQLCVAVVLLDTVKIAFYLPVLLGIGAITGTIVGICALPITRSTYLQQKSKKSTEIQRNSSK